MRDNANTELGWPAVAFLFAIAVFGVVLIDHAPKWPIYVSVFVWWGSLYRGPGKRQVANAPNDLQTLRNRRFGFGAMYE